MTRWVVDASVAVKWVVGEEHDDLAATLLLSGHELHAPCHWLAEATNTLWAKYTIRREITEDEWLDGLAALAIAPVAPAPLPGLATAAGRIATTLGVTMYDAFYIALSERLAFPFVTADRRLIRKTRGTAHEGGTRWIGDLA